MMAIILRECGGHVHLVANQVPRLANALRLLYAAPSAGMSRRRVGSAGQGQTTELSDPVWWAEAAALEAPP